MNTPKGPSLLDQWEAEATKNIPYQTIYAQNERILALIDLVRKKDEALSFYCNNWRKIRNTPEAYDESLAQTALALTDQLE